MKLTLALITALTAFCGCERAPVAAQSTAAATPPGIPCPVVGIHDGDSLTVMMDGQPVKVIIEGIDAPEMGQPHGSSGRAALSVLTAAGTVRIAETGKDRYGHTLARVHAGEADVGLEMIRQGLAWHVLHYKDEDLAEAESEAREAERGLWADEKPVPPWEWRKVKKLEEPDGE